MMDGYEQDDKDIVDNTKSKNTSTLSTEEIYDILMNGEEHEEQKDFRNN